MALAFAHPVQVRTLGASPNEVPNGADDNPCVPAVLQRV